MALSDFCLLILCIPWVWVTLNGSILSRLWPKWWDAVSKIRLQRDCGFHPPLLSVWFVVREASCHIVKTFMWPGTDDLGQQPMKASVSKWSWKNILLQSSLEMTEALANTLLCSLVRDPESEVPSEAMQGFLINRNYELINICSFKPLSLGISC